MIRVMGKEMPWQEGMTVSDLIRDLNESFDFALVRIDHKQVTRPHFHTTPIPDDSDVYLVPMIAGG
ncbi:MAG: thiamine biosynthesis protein ThiS [Desulfobacteraceae bacterium]|nr:MAG: thiamine biosynthesis protein ThiS [Desulfobacteraceae bacterium]